MHQVCEVREAAIRITDRPVVQLRLHRVYPRLRLGEARPRRAGVHQRPPHAVWMLRTRWTPSPCGRLSRPRTTTGPPPQPITIGGRCTVPAGRGYPSGSGSDGLVPMFTTRPIDGVGAQFCPCSFATGTPQSFPLASVPAVLTVSGVPHAALVVGVRCNPAHVHQVGAGNVLEERSVTGSSRTPFRLACRTHPVWQCRGVPSLSRLLPPSRPISAGQAASSFNRSLRRTTGGVLSSPLGLTAPHGAQYHHIMRSYLKDPDAMRDHLTARSVKLPAQALHTG